MISFIINKKESFETGNTMCCAAELYKIWKIKNKNMAVLKEYQIFSVIIYSFIKTMMNESEYRM